MAVIEYSPRGTVVTPTAVLLTTASTSPPVDIYLPTGVVTLEATHHHALRGLAVTWSADPTCVTSGPGPQFIRA